MSNFTIKIIKEKHFIEGDRYNVFLYQGKDCRMAIAVQVKPKDYLSMAEKLDGLKFRLESLGNKVNVETTEWADPNFETEEQAADYMMGRGY